MDLLVAAAESDRRLVEFLVVLPKFVLKPSDMCVLPAYSRLQSYVLTNMTLDSTHVAKFDAFANMPASVARVCEDA